MVTRRGTARGVDFLPGGAGWDTLRSSLSYTLSAHVEKLVVVGNLFVHGTVGGGGTDHARSSVDFTLPSGVEQQSLTGSQPLHGTGNEFAKLITSNDAANLLDGAAGADRVNGAAGDDVLVYDALDELLDGGTGVDTLRIAGSLRVSGDAGDSLTSLAQGWTADGGDAQIIDGVHYQSYSAGNAHLLVDLDLLTSASLS